jgi:serine/threonine protein kinase
MTDYMSDPIGSCGGQEIGRGGSSQVKRVQDPVTGEEIAVKYFSGPNFNLTSFVREIESLTALNHPCVLRIIHWAFPNGSDCGEIHTEFARRGSVEHLQRERNTKAGREFWSPTRIAIVICDIVLGMRFVHSQQIIHRDLKPSNVLIRGNGRALIGDFGSSGLTSEDATMTAQSGTVHYAAPELFNETVQLTPKVDVWSFGLILYELVSGLSVFPSRLASFEVIRRMRDRFRPIIPEECGRYMGGLIDRCWSDDPSCRPSFDEILREFQARNFTILPKVDCDEICAVVDRVLQWELHARVPRAGN